MFEIIALIAPFFVIAGLGACVAGLGGLTEAGVRGLTGFVYFAAFPALMLSVFLSPDAKTDLAWRLAAAYTLASLGVYAMAFALAGWGQGLSGGRRAGQALAASAGNTAFLGLPVAIALFGPEAAGLAGLIVLIDNVVVLPLAVAVLSGRDETAGRLSRVRSGMVGALTNPVVIAALLGLVGAMAGFALPQPVMGLIGPLAGAASPVALFALGATLALTAREGLLGLARGPALWVVGLKLALYPALVFAATSLFGVSGLAQAVAVLMASAPSAVNVFVQTRAAGVYEREAASAVAATTLISVFTFTATAYLMVGAL